MNEKMLASRFYATRARFEGLSHTARKHSLKEALWHIAAGPRSANGNVPAKMLCGEVILTRNMTNYRTPKKPKFVCWKCRFVEWRKRWLRF